MQCVVPVMNDLRPFSGFFADGLRGLEDGKFGVRSYPLGKIDWVIKVVIGVTCLSHGYLSEGRDVDSCRKACTEVFVRSQEVYMQTQGSVPPFEALLLRSAQSAPKSHGLF